MKRVLYYLAKMADVSPLRISVSNKIPDSLYDLCLTNLANYLHKTKYSRDVLHELPDTVLMDVYYKMLQEKCLCLLDSELSQLDTFERLMRFSGAQLKLLQCFQAVIEHGSKLSTELASVYLKRCDSTHYRHKTLIHLGLRLGSFLNEAGWYADAQRVLLKCRELCEAQPDSTYSRRITLECCHRLLRTQSSYCCFPGAASTAALTLRLLGLEGDVCSPRAAPPSPTLTAPSRDVATQTEHWDDSIPSSVSVECERACGWSGLCARALGELAELAFVRCDYSAAYCWASAALNQLTEHTPPTIVIDVVRACSKACVVKRKFGRAGALVRGAVAWARETCGLRHPKYAAALQDYGFYLLNVDSITHSVAAYEEALSIVRGVLGRGSLHVAQAHEDLAYALYVLEYSSGRFYKAREHAERAIRIIENLVPPGHLLLASAKRVKALILEEIALDAPPGHSLTEPSLLQESEELHKSALKLSMMAFGEKNVQTAKHYGNLGRLYQSMHKFQDAESMHLKAIAIKEELLGPEDYEVGLSIGHLASLYNYHMNMHCQAEKLYFRSINISLKLFGECYSGLEYDYRGLVHVFTQLKRHDAAADYSRLLQKWHELREQSQAEQQPAFGNEEMLDVDQLKQQFFNPNVD